MQNILEINNLNYLNIFNNFNLKIEKNKLTSISGPNNCGKTSLVNIISRKIKLQQDIKILDNNINNYKITDYYKIVKAIIPLEEIYIYETVEEELNYYIDQLFLNKEEKNKRIKNIQKNLSLTKIKKKRISELTKKEYINLQIAIAIASMPKLLVIDDLSAYLDNSDMKKIISYFRYLIKNYDIAIIINSTRLQDVIEADYLHIISESNVILSGKPLEVLQKDNVLNKAGIRVPFMIDLSVKLRDYNLIDDVELDMNRMLEKLWN